MNFYNESDYVIELSNKEIQLLLNMAEKIIVNPSDHPEIFCRQCKLLSYQLPKTLMKKLNDFSINGSSTGFLLIKNIPIVDEKLPNTPSSNNCKIGETTLLARIQGILISSIAEMVSYEAEGYGRLFQDIIPIQTMANNQTSVSSNVELEIHTEQAFSKLRPDILSLSCLRGDKNALTHILPIQKIIDNVNNEELQLLKQPLWNCGVDLSFKINGVDFIEGDIRGPFSIINRTNEKDEKNETKETYERSQGHTLLFDQDLMTGVNEEANIMIKKIVDIYYKHRISHNLKQGEILFVDNRRAVHGRSPFKPNYDGKDRFLIRCFATFDYDKSNYARQNNSRNILAIYS
jgi:hypothetical protein